MSRTRNPLLCRVSAVQYAARQLSEKGVLTRREATYSVSEPIFALWVSQLYGRYTLEQLLAMNAVG